MAKGSQYLDLIIRAKGSGFHAFNKMRQHLDGLGGKVKELNVRLLGLRHSFLAVELSYNLRQAANQFVEVNSGFEQMKTKLDALTKGRGAETLNNLREWAQRMPVDTRQAVDAFTTMTATGLDPTLEKMTTLADVASVFGGDTLPRVSRALGQMKTLGQVSAEELNQLAEAGINARKYLKEAFGMSVEELQNSGIAIDQVIEAIWAGLAGDFGGSAQKAMDNWTGLMARMRSAWERFLSEIGEKGSFDSLKKILEALISDIDRAFETGEASKWAAFISADVTGALKAARDSAGELLNIVKSLGGPDGNSSLTLVDGFTLLANTLTVSVNTLLFFKNVLTGLQVVALHTAKVWVDSFGGAIYHLLGAAQQLSQALGFKDQLPDLEKYRKQIAEISRTIGDMEDQAINETLETQNQIIANDRKLQSITKGLEVRKQEILKAREAAKAEQKLTTATAKTTDHQKNLEKAIVDGKVSIDSWLQVIEANMKSARSEIAQTEDSVKSLNAALSSVKVPSLGAAMEKIGGGEGFARGGLVPGFSPGDRADNILARLTAGEYVIQKPAVRHWGQAFLDKINQMKFSDRIPALPKYAGGGMVGGGGAPADFGRVTIDFPSGRVQGLTDREFYEQLTRVIERERLMDKN